MKSAILFIRTPLQAFLAEQVLIQEEVEDYDLVYITAHSSQEDLFYYNHLSRLASHTQYVYLRPKRPDIFWHILILWKSRKWITDKGRALTILGSVDSLSIRTMASRQSGSLVTLDDGTANISKDSSYRNTIKYDWKTFLYSWVFLAMTKRAICMKSLRHYTLFPEVDNIVDSHRLMSLPGWRLTSSPHPSNDAPVSFFIGAAFELDLSLEQIKTLELYLKTLSIDFYVPHPQESFPLEIGAALLNKNGLIAEDAIIKSSQGRPVLLIAHFSTVMLTLSSRVHERLMILFANDNRSIEYFHKASAIGGSPMRVVYL